jgi:Luciferase-like monooxygenase
VLWQQSRASYSAPELSFEGIHMRPKPVQAGGVPLWISGTVNRGSMQRLARFGTGWNPWGLQQDDVIEAIPRMREAVAGFGRDPSDIEVIGHLPLVADGDGVPQVEPSMENLGPLVEAGVTNVDVFLPIPAEYEAAVEYLTPWVKAFKKAIT